MVKTTATSLFLLATAALQAMAAPTSTAKIYVDDELQADSLTNIYLDYGSNVISGEMTLALSNCDSGTPEHVIGTTDITSDFQPTKFAWLVPADATGGCLTATDADGKIIAKSESYTIPQKLYKRGHPELEDMYFDAVKYYKSNMEKRSSPAAKSKDTKIGIVGAGMAGLFSGYLLDEAGFSNYEIIEANDRLGGRVHTAYFNSSHLYQEMGPMRFPVAFQYKNKTLPVTDHDIVFQLADDLNKKNKHEDKYKVEFIKWIQSMENNLYYKNGVRLPDGSIPTVGDISKNSSLSIQGKGISELSDEADKATSDFYTSDWDLLMSKDLYEAHDEAIKEGYDDWSEWGWMHNKMGVSLNATELSTGGSASQIWGSMYDTYTFSASDWRTIKGGLNRLPEAFGPVLGDKVTFNTRVSKIDYDGKKVSVQWKKSPYDEKYESKEFDNVIVAAPFTIVRGWHMPELSFTLSEAIQNLGYSQACKVALEFKTRFWEKLEKPIKGGCDSTDLISGSVCYPSYDIGSDGPGVMLSSYASGNFGLRFASMTEEQHVARVLEDMVELHGDIVKEQYTGNYNRKCWILDEFESGSWAEPEAGQHKLYMPSYFNMEKGLVFIGEHTDIKHAWISAALESSIRGVVMILVEHGHISEAKKIVKEWNAGWMKI